MRRIQIDTTARATIREAWVLEAPADLTVTTDNWADILDHPERYGARIIAARDEVLGDEDDRLLTWEDITP